MSWDEDTAFGEEDGQDFDENDPDIAAQNLVGEIDLFLAGQKVGEITDETRLMLQQRLLSLLKELNKDALNTGAPVNGSIFIGYLSAPVAEIRWNTQESKFVIVRQPPNPAETEAHIQGIGLNDPRSIATYRFGHEYYLGNPPSNSDLYALEEYVDIVTGGAVSFEHACPALDEPLRPETIKALECRNQKPRPTDDKNSECKE